MLAAEHKATEEVITASGTPATFLRNGWYTENLKQDFETARERGVIASSVAGGRLGSRPRPAGLLNQRQVSWHQRTQSVSSSFPI